MASTFTSASISASAHPRLLNQGQAVSGLVMPKSISISSTRRFPSLQHAASGLRVACSAKPETVEKVCQIVKKQLALDADRVVTGESKFQELGADSLDTVEIVMGIEEEFGIAVEEENAQSITTVQNAADLVEDLISKAA